MIKQNTKPTNGKPKKKSTKKKNKGGRPSKIDVIPDGIFKALYETGLTDMQVSKLTEVDESTLNRWKKKNNGFYKSLKEGKKIADDAVVKSLFKRACGYKAELKRSMVVSDGKDAGSHLEYGIVEQEFAPDTTACIFWLKNRIPKEWRDKVNLQLGVDDDPDFRNAFFGVKGEK